MKNVEAKIEALVGKKFTKASAEELIADVKALLVAKPVSSRRAKTYVELSPATSENEAVYANFCYYHQKWERTDVVAYGRKAKRATGLDTFCKEGCSQWTKRTKRIKNIDSEILEMLQKGEIAVEDMQSKKITLEAEIRADIVPHSKGHGFETENEAIEDFKNDSKIEADIDKRMAENREADSIADILNEIDNEEK